MEAYKSKKRHAACSVHRGSGGFQDQVHMYLYVGVSEDPTQPPPLGRSGPEFKSFHQRVTPLV